MPLYRLDDQSGLIAALNALQRQTVLWYSGATARDAQVLQPWRGLLTWNDIAGRFEYWNGTGYVMFGAADPPLADRLARLEARLDALEEP